LLAEIIIYYRYLMGLWSRTLRLVACGIKPAFVFDSVRAPGAAAQPQSAAPSPPGDRRVVRVTPTHVEECKKLLGLMGMPVVQAPAGGEAEAQCAELCRAGKVFAVGSEDMDALTFGAPVLLRHLTFSEARKLPIVEIELPKGACVCPHRRGGVCALARSLTNRAHTTSAGGPGLDDGAVHRSVYPRRLRLLRHDSRCDVQATWHTRACGVLD
jgi:hypothetical protein